MPMPLKPYNQAVASYAAQEPSPVEESLAKYIGMAAYVGIFFAEKGFENVIPGGLCVAA